MKIIDPKVFYDILITGESDNELSELSLYALNTEIDEDSRDGLRNKFDLEVFNESGEWLENQRNEFNTENDIEEKVYGNFNYLSTVLDESSYILPQYTEIFKIELIVPEKFRNTFIPFFDGYASEVITSNKIKLYGVNNGSDELIKYISLNIKRENDVILDNRASEEKKYDMSKSDLTFTIGSLYNDTYLTKQVFKYLLHKENLETPVNLKYRDDFLNETIEYNTYIIGANVI